MPRASKAGACRGTVGTLGPLFRAGAVILRLGGRTGHAIPTSHFAITIRIPVLALQANARTLTLVRRLLGGAGGAIPRPKRTIALRGSVGAVQPLLRTLALVRGLLIGTARTPPVAHHTTLARSRPVRTRQAFVGARR